MKKAITFEKFEIKSEALLGFEIEFRLKEDHTNIQEELSKLVGEEVRFEDIGEYTNNYQNIILRRKWSRGGIHFEIVTDYREYESALNVLDSILGWMKKKNVKTDQGTGLHVNISFQNKNIRRGFNPLKFALLFNEENVYNAYNRTKSFYARPIFDFIKLNPNVLLSDFSNIVDQFEFPKHNALGLNLNHENYIEARYIGGENYHQDVNKIHEVIDELIVAVSQAHTQKITTEEKEKLKERLVESVKKVKAFRNYQKFTENYPNVKLFVDLNDDEQVIKTYWNKIASLLYHVAPNVGATKMLVNYDTDIVKLQIKEAYLMDILQANDVEFYNSTVRGVFNDCFFMNTDVRNSIINNGYTVEGKIKNSKVKNSKIFKYVEISKSFFIKSDIYSDVDNQSVLYKSEVKKPAEVSQRTKIIK